jgi:hypothetical protein
VLHLHAHDTLRLLVGSGGLARKPIEQSYVYLSAETLRASAQWTQRRRLAVRAVPAQPEPSHVIEVLLELVRHPTDNVDTLSERVRAAGHAVPPAEAEAILDRFDLKETLRARSRRWKR